MMQQQQMEDDQRWLEQEESFMVISNAHMQCRKIHSSQFWVWCVNILQEKYSMAPYSLVRCCLSMWVKCC